MSNPTIPAALYKPVMDLVDAGYSVEDALAKASARSVSDGNAARNDSAGSPARRVDKNTESPVKHGSGQTKAKSELERYLFHGGWGRVETEHRFHPVRRWRADYYLPDQDPPVLVEYDGLMNNKRHGSNVGHASITGIIRDSEKLNAATAMGIRCFRANAKSIHDGSFFELLNTVLQETVTPERNES